jgi:hypothetical protein
MRHEGAAPGSANQSIGYRTTEAATAVYRSLSSSVLGGGFDLFLRWSWVNNNAGFRLFAGMQNAAADPSASADPSALTNAVGVGKDAADTNLQFMQNDASGTCTKTSLGVSLATLAGHVLELWLHCLPNATQIDYELLDVNTGATYTGSVNSNLPAADAKLYPLCYLNTAATGVAVTFDFMRAVLAHDR